MRYIFFLSVIFCILSGCSKNETPNEEQSASISAIKLSPKKYESGSADKNLDGSSTQIEQKIIKEATLRFETDNLENTFNQVQKAVSNNKARIINDSEGKDFATLFRNLTIKVPSQNFDRFISDISKGVSYFERKDISSENVTEQYIDLTARLKTKRKLEERYLQILQNHIFLQLHPT